MLASTALSLLSLATAAPAAPAGPGHQLHARGADWKDVPEIHYVTVGKDGLLKYEPEVTYAKKGDVVLFEFFARNHTVSQSSFDSPCTKLESPFNSNVDIGIDSSFNFATESTDGKNQPLFAFTVQDDKAPIWLYCRQTVPVSHCQSGMVAAINPPKEGNTFDKFLAKAKASGKDDKKDDKKDEGKKDGEDKQEEKKDEGNDDKKDEEKSYYRWF